MTNGVRRRPSLNLQLRDYLTTSPYNTLLHSPHHPLHSPHHWLPSHPPTTSFPNSLNMSTHCPGQLREDDTAARLQIPRWPTHASRLGGVVSMYNHVEESGGATYHAGGASNTGF
ncbi:hypothetical protein Hypma_013304 [Hypsizygus marmoreus]|uniref:Uncharacterized protein n=1 Tax=Hypsizygus marmoreus TaxID=39966 RepID=A0A369JJW5_HYPMA|nr:hypothetical protein Hypma_013304 [Hypsizygus marmoreus]